MRKYNLDSDKGKKGYLQIDFTFAAAIFLIFFSIMYGVFNNFTNAQEDSLIISSFQDQAESICHQLISTTGQPQNWIDNTTLADFVGFKSDNSSWINNSRLNAFNSSTYFDIYDSMNLDEFLYVVVIGVETGIIYLDFGSTTGLTSYSSSYSCYSVFNGEVVRVLVEVWR